MTGDEIRARNKTGEAAPASAGAAAALEWVKPRVLTGRHVRVEPLGPEHAEDLLAAAADPEIWPYMAIARPRTLDDIGQMIASAGAARARGEQMPFAIIDQASGTAVGSSRYLDIEPVHGRLEIGWTWLGRPWWRTAVNTEAKLLLLGHAFGTVGAGRVALKTDGRNVRSQAAIARLGAQREGVLRRHQRCPDGFIRDTVYFSILADEWPAVRDGLQARLAADGRA